MNFFNENKSKKYLKILSGYKSFDKNFVLKIYYLLVTNLYLKFYIILKYLKK